MWVTEPGAENICPDCELLDNEVFVGAEDEQPPLHPGCRCKAIQQHADGSFVSDDAKAALKGASSTGVMVALRVPSAVAAQIIDLKLGDEPGDELHVTLAYCGKISDSGINRKLLEKEVSFWADGTEIITGRYNGTVLFSANPNDDGKCAHALTLDAPGLGKARAHLVGILTTSKIPVSDEHDFIAHTTVGYEDPEGAISRPLSDPIPVTFNEVEVVWGPDVTTYALGGHDDAN
jgi:2'-5' RNA ligase